MNCLIVIILSLMVLAPLIAAFKIEWGIYLSSTCRLDTKEKEVVLTFDDGPENENLPELLDLLDKKGVKSTFFFIGKYIVENKEMVARTGLAGHNIGIHTYTHAPMLPFYSVKRLAHEIYLTKHLIKSIINKDVTMFRPPFGVTNPNIAYGLSSEIVYRIPVFHGLTGFEPVFIHSSHIEHLYVLSQEVVVLKDELDTQVAEIECFIKLGKLISTSIIDIGV